MKRNENKLVKLFFLFNIFLVAIFTITCKKKPNENAPTIKLKQNNGFIYRDTLIGKCSLMNFGIYADGQGAKITNLVITTESDGLKKTLIDFGLFKDVLDTTISIYKSDNDEEIFTIKVMNKNRLFAVQSVKIYKSSQSSCGAINSYQSITLGFQNNTQYPHFLDADSNKFITSNLSSNLLNTTDIVVYYYLDGGKPSPTFSSPGDLDAPSYYPELNSWMNLPYTAWDYMTVLNVNDFNAITDASGLIAAYNQVWGRRKYKYAYKDFVFPFKTAEGKLGMVKINYADNDANGKVVFDLKIQQ